MAIDHCKRKRDKLQVGARWERLKTCFRDPSAECRVCGTRGTGNEVCISNVECFNNTPGGVCKCFLRIRTLIRRDDIENVFSSLELFVRAKAPIVYRASVVQPLFARNHKVSKVRNKEPAELCNSFRKTTVCRGSL